MSERRSINPGARIEFSVGTPVTFPPASTSAYNLATGTRSTRGDTAMRKALLLLGILNDSDLDWLIATGSKRVLSPGTVLIRQGDPIDDVFLVLDGVLSV